MKKLQVVLYSKENESAGKILSEWIIEPDK